MRRVWFDYRWREGICGQGRALTAWELWPLMKPWRKDQAGNAMRREGLDLAPPDNAPGRGKVRIPMNPNTRYDVFEHLGSEAAMRPTRGSVNP